MYEINSPIKQWAEEDRPREKLILKGRHSLSDAEIIAILLNTGIRGKSALELARRLLGKVQNKIQLLAKLSVSELQSFEGVGQAKAVTLVAALELGRRKKEGEETNLERITCSKDIYNFMYPVLSDLSHEEFWIVLLNRANKVLLRQRISMGGVSGTVADPKVIFKIALGYTASSLIICHNHPSGNLNPSTQDLDLTRKIRAGAYLLDILLLDHLIFTDKAYTSFADEGWFSK